MSAPAALRALLLALLAAALVVPALWRAAPADGAARALWLRAGDAERRADSLLLADAPAAIARDAAAPPTGEELDVLAALARRAPLYAALPADASWLAAEAPVLPRAGRAAAVGFRLRAAPGDSVTVRLADETGVLDSLRARVGETGEVQGAFRVRPPRPGWREWTVTAGERAARTGAHVDSAGPPRVWVRAGLPHWEANFLVRALEESGAVVETAFDLGRGLAVEQGGAGAVTAARLAGYDAVVLLDAAPATDAERRTLAEWADSGGGVVLTGAHAAAGAFALASGGTRETPLQAEAIRWDVPAELAPLPAASLRSGAVLAGAPRAGSGIAAVAGDAAVLTLRSSGRGRAAGLGLVETWRWRMEAGRVDEHREFWRSLVDWAAAAPPAGAYPHVPVAIGTVGAAHEVLVYGTSGDGPPPPVIVTRPGGGADTVTARAVAGRPGVARITVTPADTGVHLVETGDGRRAGFTVRPVPEAEDGWARLALLAYASGGAMVDADSLRPMVRRLTAAGPPDRRLPLAWLFLAAIAAVAGVEWLLRRLAGEP